LLTKKAKPYLYNEGQLQNLFLLNDLDGGIRGVVHAPNDGNLVASASSVYRINSSLKQFDLVKNIGANLTSLKFLSPDRVYTMDKAANQVVRLNLSSNVAQNLIKTSTDLGQARDFGVDADIYVLFPDHVAKFVNGNEQIFKLNMSDAITDANRIVVASNLYILESSKKRLLIFNKNGVLVNQVSFPNVTALKDLYVDETQRFIYLLDDNKLIQVVF